MVKIRTFLLLLLLLPACLTAGPARLPRPRTDRNIWGALINQFLRVSHNEDGTLKATAISESDPCFAAFSESDPCFAVSLANDVNATWVSNWDAGYNNTPTAIAFNEGDGIVTLTQQDAGTLTTDSLDGRYYTETEIGTWRSSVTQTEMGYVDGVTSDIQTQIGTKLADVVDDESPQLGGDLDGQSTHDLTNIVNAEFEGTIGVGTARSDAAVIKAMKTIDAAYVLGVQGSVTNVKSAPTVVTATTGMTFNAILIPASPGPPGQLGATSGMYVGAYVSPEIDETQSMTAPQIIGADITAQIKLDGTASATLTVPEMHGARFYLRSDIADDDVTGDIDIAAMYGTEVDFHLAEHALDPAGQTTVANAYGYFMKSAIKTSGADSTYTNLFSFYDQGQTAGDNNYGLGINTANNYINGSLRIGSAAAPLSTLHLDLATEDYEIVDAGSAAATEQDWIEVEIGGVTGYIRIFAAK